MGSRYPQPDNEDAFEQLCVRLYRKLWDNESLTLYAKRGEGQDGVDIFDPLCIKPIRAVQCKFHESTKPLPPAEIKAEVAKAENSHLGIERYVIATTAKKGRKAQDTIVELNRRSDKKFTVEIHFWEEICQHASERGKMAAELIIYGEIILAGTGGGIRGITPSAMLGPLTVESRDGHEPFLTIEKLLDERRLEVARYELEKLPQDAAAQSLPREQQYKLLRLRAKLQLEAGEFEKAGNLFLQAHPLSPELDQAKQNQVLGLFLIGESAKAYARAKAYVAEGLTTPVMILRLIDSITREDQLKEHASVIATHVTTDEGVNTALSHKYRSFGHHEKASEAAERALRIAPDSPHAHLAVALSLHSQAVYGELPLRQSRLKSALEHYDSAATAAEAQRFANLLPEILVNRAAAKMLLRNKPGAASDYRAAVTAAKKRSVYAERAIGYFLQEADFDSATGLIELLDPTTPEGRYLISVVRYHTGNALVKKQAFDEMKSLAEHDWDRAVESRFQCVQWFLDAKDPVTAKHYVTHSFQQDHAFQAYVMLAWIHLDSNEKDMAKADAIKALNESIKAAHPQELRMLAVILLKLQDDARALGLLEQLAMPGVFDDDQKDLISCAQRLGRHDLLLRICREVREAGTKDEQLEKLEVQLLSLYVPKEAFALADEFSRESSKPWYFVALRNFLAVRLNQLEHLNLELSALPTPAQLLPSEANLVVQPYVLVAKYDEALKFLYTQRRLNFEDEHAHGSYLFFFLTHGHRTALREPPSVVGNDCAVLLETNNGEKRWVVIEDDHPIPSRDEFAATSPLGVAVIGYKLGDIVELPGSAIQPVTGTIREIQTKYVRAFQEGLHNFVHRFPDTSMLQQFDVGEGDTFDPSLIIEALRGRRDFVEKCLELYCHHPCSVFLFARSVGISELDAIKALAAHPKGAVKCCQTTPQEFASSAGAGIVSEGVVLSISAIITLTLLDAWPLLDPTKKYFVSQLTSELVDSWIHDLEIKQPKEGGVVALDAADNLIFRESTPAENSARLEEIRKLKAMIEGHCEVVASITTAELAPERRKLYTDLIGLHNLEAMSVARDRGATLWTDDLVVAFIGKSDFGALTVWTQLALRCFVESRHVSLEQFDLFTAKLLSWNYETIVWNSATIVASGRQAQWSTNTWPLLQCLSAIKKSSASKVEKARIVAEFLRLLRRSDCKELMQSAIIQAVLNSLADPPAVRAMLRQVDQIFGVDIPSAQFVRVELTYWLRLH